MTRPQETFTDMLARLFPMPGIQLGINSPHSKCITFQVTEDCNLRCSYCYQGCKTHRKMSLETAKAAVDMLLAADERANQYITSTEVAGVVLDFIGGEPLLEVELIDQILDYFVAQTFRLHHPWATRWKASMSTNGTLYFRPEVQRFLDKWAKHLSLSISIDGDKQLHDSCRVFPDGSGSYDLAIAAAKDYMTKGNALGSKMTIAPGNVDYLYHAVIGLLDAGYRAINLNCVYEKGWTLDYAPQERPVRKRGTHGFNNRDRDMHMVFYGSGPAFRKGYRQRSFQNQNMYLILCRLLGIEPAPNDGEWRDIKRMFNEN